MKTSLLAVFLFYCFASLHAQEVKKAPEKPVSALDDAVCHDVKIIGKLADLGPEEKEKKNIKKYEQAFSFDFGPGKTLSLKSPKSDLTKRLRFYSGKYIQIVAKYDRENNPEELELSSISGTATEKSALDPKDNFKIIQKSYCKKKN